MSFAVILQCSQVKLPTDLEYKVKMPMTEHFYRKIPCTSPRALGAVSSFVGPMPGCGHGRKYAWYGDLPIVCNFSLANRLLLMSGLLCQADAFLGPRPIQPLTACRVAIILGLSVSSAHIPNKVYKNWASACSLQMAVLPLSFDAWASTQGPMELNKISSAMHRLVHCILTEIGHLFPSFRNSPDWLLMLTCGCIRWGRSLQLDVL